MPTWLYLLTPCVVTATGSLQCDIPMLDRGEVKRGPAMTVEFPIRNAGAGPVVIDEVRTSCGCLRPEVGTRTLAGGAATTVRVDVNTLSQPLGPSTWRLTVCWRADDGTAAGELTLAASATLTGEVMVEPAMLSVTGGAEGWAEVRLTDPRADPLRLVGVATTLPGVVVEQTSARAGAFTVRVRASAQTGGARHGFVVLATSDATYAELKVPLTVRPPVTERVRAAPEAVSLRPTPEQPTPALLVQLRDADGEPVRVESVDTAGLPVAVRFAAGSGGRALVRFRYEGPGAAAGEGVARVRVVAPVAQEVVIPVRWGGQ